MNTDKMMELIKKFDESSNNAHQMIDELDKFGKVLANYNITYEEIKQLKDKIMPKEIEKEMAELTYRVQTLSQSVEARVEECTITIQQLDKQLEMSNTNIEETITNLDEKLESIDAVANKLADTNEIIQKLDKILNTGVKKAVNLLENRVTDIEKILKDIHGVEVELKNNYEVLRVSQSNIENIIHQQERTIKNNQLLMEEIIDEWDQNNKLTFSYVKDLMNKNDKLLNVIESMEQSNVATFNQFNLVLDEWAKQSIRRIVIKKKKTISLEE